MLKNYINSTIRTLSNNKSYSFLNIFGLALGIAAFIFIDQYVTVEKSYDTFHKNYKDLYRVQYQGYQNNELIINSAAAVPKVGPFMKEKMPQVVDFARTYPVFGIIESEGFRAREEKIYFADPSFLQIFDFPLLHGEKSEALNAPNQVVLTESAAMKYFGTKDVVGRPLAIKSWFSTTSIVTAVTEDVPSNSHFQFDFLISYETLNRENQGENGFIASEDLWDWSSFYTYVQLHEGTELEAFNQTFNDVLVSERGEHFESSGQIDAFPLQRVTDIHLYSNLQREVDPRGQGDGQAVFFLTLIAFFILSIAWINYINLATARSADRSKEVGVRKTMGAQRSQLIYQFLTEAFVLNLLALVLGSVIVYISIVTLGNFEIIKMTPDFMTEIRFWMLAVGVLVFGSTLSGLYPAFVLSSFKPAAIFSRRMSGGIRKVSLRQGLVVFQFAISISLIACSIVVFEQLAFLKDIDKGFEVSDKMVIEGPTVLDYDSDLASTMAAFKNQLLQSPDIESVSGSSNIPGEEIIWTNEIKLHKESENKLKTVSFIGADYDYFSTYKIDLLAGRDFRKSFTVDTGSVIVNLEASELLGFNDPIEAIGEQITMYDDPKTIIGVVDNYKQMTAKAPANSIVFPFSPEDAYFFTVSLTSKNYDTVIKYASKTYDEFYPGNSFEHFYLDSFFNRQYEKEEKFGSVFSLFTSLAIIIACLGLFGLTSYSALKRTKEIGIRKTLGASISSLVMILSKESVLLLLISNLLAWPVIYFAMTEWLANFASRISLDAWIFIGSGALVLAVALITIGFKMLKTAKSNPIDALRYE